MVIGAQMGPTQGCDFPCDIGMQNGPTGAYSGCWSAFEEKVGPFGGWGCLRWKTTVGFAEGGKTG